MSNNNTLDLTDISSEPVETNIQVEVVDLPVEESSEEEKVEEKEVEEEKVEEQPVEEEKVEEDKVEEQPVEESVEEQPVEVDVAVEEEKVEVDVAVEVNVSVEEVIENVKDILTAESDVSEVPVKSFNDKLVELIGIIHALNFRDEWNSRLSALKSSTDSDEDKLNELIDVTKYWRFNVLKKKKKALKNISECSVEERFLELVNIVEVIGLREPLRLQLIALKQ